MMNFFVGLHQPSDAFWFQRVCISINRIKYRQSGFKIRDWILDSGAFTVLNLYGEYPHPVEVYADQIMRVKHNGNLLAAVSQDYMCEPFILQKTGMSITEHQILTIDRYRQLLKLTRDVRILPVLQGYSPLDYVLHLEQYGSLLTSGMWVGVGSVCKRNSNPESIRQVLTAIKRERPDLRLHGFGLKITALQSPLIRDLLYSSDSMAWSFHARKQGRDQNSWKEAMAFVDRIESL